MQGASKGSLEIQHADLSYHHEQDLQKELATEKVNCDHKREEIVGLRVSAKTYHFWRGRCWEKMNRFSNAEMADIRM